MTNIVNYKKTHQNEINAMMQEIALEFEEQILPKTTKETPKIPDTYWVAIHNKKVIGTVGVLVVENQYGILKKMMLKKEFRGKKLGVSKKMLTKVIRWSEENGILKIYLGTMSQFKAAHSFYKNNGFMPIKESELPHDFLKNPLDTVFFVKTF